MYHNILFNDEDELDNTIFALQQKPRLFYERINYLELYDEHDFYDSISSFKNNIYYSLKTDWKKNIFSFSKVISV